MRSMRRKDKAWAWRRSDEPCGSARHGAHGSQAGIPPKGRLGPGAAVPAARRGVCS